jgi:hypothetical protein
MFHLPKMSLLKKTTGVQVSYYCRKKKTKNFKEWHKNSVCCGFAQSQTINFDEPF